MRFLIALTMLVACAAAAGFTNDPYWLTYKAQYGKVYASEDIEEKRYNIFLRNMANAARFNAMETGTATYGWTVVSDRDPDELLKPLKVPDMIVRSAPTNEVVNDVEFDLRTLGAVTPVKDQASCGSCWAFCTVATMEGAFFSKYGKLVGFSEQQLVDCDKTNHGCNGGWPTTAMEWIAKNDGLMTEADYKYTAKAETCKFVKAKAELQVDPATIETLARGSVDTMKKYMKEHLTPISVAVNANKFSGYTGGIMAGKDCSSASVNHGIAVVGWGSEGGMNYWIVKNSWGASWGEKGYIRIELGVNACAIEAYPMVCLVK